jgi:uncharacterized protein involved in cysteine biosynthesis
VGRLHWLVQGIISSNNGPEALQLFGGLGPDFPGPIVLVRICLKAYLWTLSWMDFAFGKYKSSFTLSYMKRTRHYE